MAYEWDSLLESGHELIDSQHKQLLDALKRLMESYHSEAGKDEVTRAVEFLLTYTAKHFNDEEALQIQYQYPDYLRHRQIHNEFKQVAIKLAERLKSDGASLSLLAEVHSSIGDWFINHIMGDDFRMAAFIKSRTTPQAGN